MMNKYIIDSLQCIGGELMLGPRYMDIVFVTGTYTVYRELDAWGKGICILCGYILKIKQLRKLFYGRSVFYG